jgi:hypothetical protein
MRLHLGLFLRVVALCSVAVAAEAPAAVIAELGEKLPDFRQAWDENGLATGAFAHYGPVQRFRRQFIHGWDELLAAIRAHHGR